MLCGLTYQPTKLQIIFVTSFLKKHTFWVILGRHNFLAAYDFWSNKIPDLLGSYYLFWSYLIHKIFANKLIHLTEYKKLHQFWTGSSKFYAKFRPLKRIHWREEWLLATNHIQSIIIFLSKFIDVSTFCYQSRTKFCRTLYFNQSEKIMGPNLKNK